MAYINENMVPRIPRKIILTNYFLNLITLSKGLVFVIEMIEGKIWGINLRPAGDFVIDLLYIFKTIFF